VLLPAFDAEATLASCLESIRRQTEPRWECIVVDDGSRDATRACAEWFARRDPRVKLLAAPHRGLVAALNAGLEACTGRYVARMDADDLMHRDRLRLQAAALDEQLELAAVGCRVRIFPRRHLSDGLRAYERWLNGIDPLQLRAEAFVECPIAHPTLMIRRAVLRELGYRDRGWPEDYDLILRLLAARHAVATVPRRLLHWRDRPERLSRTAATYRLERFTACKAAFLASGFLSRSETYVLWGYGHTGRALRRALLPLGKRPAQIVELHPGRLGQTIHGAPVITPWQLTGVPRRPVVVSVAGDEPRRQIRAAMAELGLRELDDFVCAA
jgi:glycosyltransferase involved in cell wall biosynthesis